MAHFPAQRHGLKSVSLRFKRLSKKKEKQSLLAKNKWIFKKKQKKAA